MESENQNEFPFASLDFPGRTALYPKEMAERNGVTAQHILDLIEEKSIPAIDWKGINNKSDRCTPRIPIEVYRNVILSRLTCDLEESLFGTNPLETLPPHTLVRLHKQLTALLKSKGLI